MRIGDTKWTFRTVPQADDFGSDSWQNESWRYSGNTNARATFAVDDELSYISVPTGTPTCDYYGGHRLGDNLFAESLVALGIETGQRIWHVQAVHHGVWDYDSPTHPNLVDITVDGPAVNAVAQVSKQGFTYVFDRETWDPVWPTEERPVEPNTDLDGDVLSPTQPFPTKPQPFEDQGRRLTNGSTSSQRFARWRSRRCNIIGLEGCSPHRSCRQTTGCRAPSSDRRSAAAPTGRARRSTPRPESSTCRRSTRSP